MKTLLLSLACAALAATASAFPSTYRVSGRVVYAPRGSYVVATCAPRVAVVATAPVCYTTPVYAYAQPVGYLPGPAYYARPEVVYERVSAYGHWGHPGYPRVAARVVVCR